MRRAAGADFGGVCPAARGAAPQAKLLGPRAKLRHYAGGAKPEQALADAARCARGDRLRLSAKPLSGFWRLIRPAKEGKLAGVAQEIARALSWGERTKALGAELLGTPQPATPRDFDARWTSPCSSADARSAGTRTGEAPPPVCTLLRSCVATLDNGLRCLRAELAFYNVTLLKRNTAEAPEVLSGAAFMERHNPERRGGISAAVPAHPSLHFRPMASH